MPLHPLRHLLAELGRASARGESPFKVETDAALGAFHKLRDDLLRKVRHGELTTKVAREQALAAARDMRSRLLQQSEQFSPVSKAFLDRLIDAGQERVRANSRRSLESLQRETNRLLRAGLVEQQLVTRTVEFEGQAFLRPMAGGPPVPTLDSLLAFHERACQAGDDAAMEWGRRQLEGMRNLVIDAEDQRKIDRSCDRPDRLNPRIVIAYFESLRDANPDVLETFLDQAVSSQDASACAAAFLLARESPQGTALRWVRKVLDRLREFPDVALETLRAWETEARRRETEAARHQAEFTLAIAESDARLEGFESPSQAAIDRLTQIESKPLARPDEPVGLKLERRGATAQEYEQLTLDHSE